MKKKPVKADDDWYEPSYIIGTGSYMRIGSPSAKTKMKQIGFVRQKKHKKTK